MIQPKTQFAWSVTLKRNREGEKFVVKAFGRNEREARTTAETEHQAYTVDVQPLGVEIVR